MRPGFAVAALAVARNELRIWFLAGSGWVFLTSFLFLAGLFFTVALGATGEASLRASLPNLAVTLVFTLPLVTMRQLAEEARSGTWELLATAPIPLPALLLGKWAAAVGLCAMLLAATAPFPIVLAVWGDPDPGVLAVSYLGLFLCCATFSAAGLFASSLTRDPMVAGVLGVVILLPSWLASAARDRAPAGAAAFLDRISFVEHLRSFAVGVVDTGDLAWFAGATAVFLVATWSSVESRRGR
ncbi:MAG: ABC transporter permease [Myxococcota bacterium]